MATLETADIDNCFALFKGEPGTRKSTAALSYPTPQYWVSTDQKMGALRIPANKWGVKRGDVHYDDYVDWNKVHAKLKQLALNCPFKTVIVDSISSMGDCMTSQVKDSKTGGGKMIGGIPVSGFEEFNAESSAFQ